ncbi:hypothetical protein JF527_005111, partial [Salmonella enterica]|nr:hypothetical protein [Salmonella enterica]
MKRLTAQKVAVPEVQQGKTVVSHGKYRESSVALSFLVSELVVVENNTLGKDKIYDINPMLKVGIEDVDGELL